MKKHARSCFIKTGNEECLILPCMTPPTFVCPAIQNVFWFSLQSDNDILMLCRHIFRSKNNDISLEEIRWWSVLAKLKRTRYNNLSTLNKLPATFRSEKIVFVAEWCAKLSFLNYLESAKQFRMTYILVITDSNRIKSRTTHVHVRATKRCSLMIALKL